MDLNHRPSVYQTDSLNQLRYWTMKILGRRAGFDPAVSSVTARRLPSSTNGNILNSGAGSPMETRLCSGYRLRPITGLASIFCQIPPPARKPDTQPSGRGVGRHPTMNTRVKMDHRAGFAPSLSGFADPHLIYSAIGG